MRGRGELLVEGWASSPSTPSSGSTLKGLSARELGRELRGCVRERVRRSCVVELGRELGRGIPERVVTSCVKLP